MIERISLSSSRAERNAQLRQLFPEVAGVDSVFEGGRAAALQRLRKLDAAAYGRTRNSLDGRVSRLSPYFRHGMLTLHEAADFALTHFKGASYKFVFELAWRDFWRRVQAAYGARIEQSIEPPKVPIGQRELPEDIINAATGLACMDAFARELVETGYVHNHARMWFASYVVHHRKVDWRAAAQWYYGELIDGDRASNHLSWQWIASTFSSKPYLFNRENLERYSDGVYCEQCPAKRRCPFDQSYESLHEKLFSTEFSQ